MKISDRFPRYTEFDPKVPVWCVTPNEGRAMHRFFDTSPFSPSGRYLAALRLPYEDRWPSPGDEAQVVLVDLQTAEEMVVADTRGWEVQMGANINWGADDATLLFNDVDPKTWIPFCVKLNPLTGEKRRLDGTIYRVSPDGKKIISSCMRRMRRTQFGYGVWVPDGHVPRNIGPRDDDGLYETDTATGECRLLVSLKTIVGHMRPQLDPAEIPETEFYGFHCKYNRRGTRLIWTLRWHRKQPEPSWNMISKGLRFDVFTMKPDGTDIHDAVPWPEWDKGGHHINWYPDGETLSMNLPIDGREKGLFFVKARYDGSDYGKIVDEPRGSGHPTVHPDGKHILTDCYVGEGFGDPTTPLRWIDLKEKTATEIVRIGTRPPAQAKDGSLRLDPHPAWDLTDRFVAFNACPDGTRRVYVAGLTSLIG